MENDQFQRKQDSVYSVKVKAGKRRTYFFDVRKTKGEDFYLTLTESTRRFNDEGYERHKIFLYKEDFEKFMEGLNESIEVIKENAPPIVEREAYSDRESSYSDKGTSSSNEEVNFDDLGK